MTEKKLKQVKSLNLDSGAIQRNGNAMANSMVLNTKGFAPRLSMNGVAVNRPIPFISPDFAFPPGGFPSLHLPAVVVLVSCFRFFPSRFSFLLHAQLIFDSVSNFETL